MKPTAILVAVILTLAKILFVGCSFNTKKTEIATQEGRLILPEVPVKEENITSLPPSNHNEASSQKAIKIKPVKPLIETIIAEVDTSPCSGPTPPPFPEEDHRDSIIWDKVEIEAEYPGGPAAWQRYLNKNLRYPEEELENESQGSILVQFVVDRDGNVSDVEAIKGSEAWRKEAVRVIMKSGRWIPAVINGRYVRSLKKQPFIVHLEAE